MYRILNYTRIKPRSRPPQKNPHTLCTPIFSGQNRKKSAQITWANTVVNFIF